MNDPAIAIPNLLYTYADLIDAADFVGAARLFRHGGVVADGRGLRPWRIDQAATRNYGGKCSV